jgi:uncharacterized membrane protein
MVREVTNMSDTHIRNPFEVGLEQAVSALAGAGRAIGAGHHAEATPALQVRRITIHDLRDSLAMGLADLGAYRADILFIGLIYPLAGLFLAQAAYGHSLLPLVFPLASGFVLIGPLAAVGLYEISLRREQGVEVRWTDVFGVLRSPAFGSMVLLGLVLTAIFLAWLGAAYGIYLATLGPQPPASAGAFIRDVFTTSAGWMMIVAGVGVGFLFAVASFAISVVSFPLLLDRHVGVGAAVATSVRAVIANPVPMAAWGLIVAGGLVLGSLPALVGLIIVMPVLGHATFHLYRKLVSAA